MKTVLFLITTLLMFTACAPEADFKSHKEGTDGTSCRVSQTATGALVSCTDGTSVTVSDGAQGSVGNSGANGSSCSVSQLPNQAGAMIACPGSNPVAVLNGTNGAAGLDAVPVVPVKLCNSAASNFPEYAFNINGKLYAVYSASNNASLALLTPGTYTTTAPGQNCQFTVAADGFTVTH